MDTNIALPLTLENMPEAFREAFECPEDEVSVEYVRPERMERAERHPEEATELQDRVRFAIVAGSGGTFEVWRNDSCTGLAREGQGLGFEQAQAKMFALAEAWPNQHHIMDLTELRNYIIENHCHAISFFEDVSDVRGSLGNPEEGDLYLSWLWWAPVTGTNGCNLWVVDGANNECFWIDVFPTKNLAIAAAREEGDFASWNQDKVLLSDAEDEWAEAVAAGDGRNARELYKVIHYLRNCVRRA